MSRSRVDVPFGPHSAEQSLHGVQGVTSQSTTYKDVGSVVKSLKLLATYNIFIAQE